MGAIIARELDEIIDLSVDHVDDKGAAKELLSAAKKSKAALEKILA